MKNAEEKCRKVAILLHSHCLASLLEGSQKISMNGILAQPILSAHKQMPTI